ncbi:MAG: tRNA 2-thiouridine(34) synthase MnmA [Lachnospiraceae bacterium]|nr:tRNA 2-thiouridine(34) synthase MnmA [Lachnospiraceae bacterium]
MDKALIAMSGGVDSSVAAYLTKENGYECIGCMMKLYSNEDTGEVRERTCCTSEDAEDARSVAFRLGIPFYVFNLSDLFREKVIDKFIGCYEKGITPNPCIDCNRYMKFEKLYERAVILGCEKIVTGHYARIEKTKDGYVLKKSVDPDKDQSYVLYSLTQDQLAHTMFPLGEQTKEKTRSIAEKMGFVNAAKPDSQDICFVPDGDYAAAIKRFSGKEYAHGKFVDREGNILGEHRGIVCYTIGQRKGLGISSTEPYYVCDIRTDTNEVVLGRNDDLFGTQVNVCDVNRIVPYADNDTVRVKAKIRYRQKEQDAVVTFLPEKRAKLVFDEPQRAVTKGQAAVFYDGDVVIGGGTIC